jgi:tyrosyl-tRNA synthetase
MAMADTKIKTGVKSMSENVFDTLKERGFVAQCTNEEAVRDMLGKEKVSFYTGYDATADSLTAGHFLTVMAMQHLQRAGHRPIALIGGGTTLIGDPSGRTDMRQMLTREQVDYNANRFKEQLSKFIRFDDKDGAILVNNADWLLDLKYVEFLREVGVHFTVNNMLRAEAYKNRWERGLTVFEFNYMLMQAYDFYVLNKKYGTKLEVGGDDQWSNMLAGADLIRRKESKDAEALTLHLLTTSDGKKMGKTMKGALWLDPKKTSPYEFYQYWRNIEDAKVEECLALLTFLPMEQVRDLGSLKDSEINKAKEVLAFEITKMVHNEEEAEKAQEAARSLFGGSSDSNNIPAFEYPKAKFEEGIDLISMLVDAKMATNRSDARRNIEQGGVTVNGTKCTDVKKIFKLEDLDSDGNLLVKKGKKSFIRFKAGV